MKKIKKFKKFENVQDEDEFDYDYVKQCFIDLIESNTIEYIDNDYVEIVYKKFATPELLGTEEWLGSVPRGLNSTKRWDSRNLNTQIKPFHKIESYTKGLEETKEVMLDIQAGIERVLEEYPEYKCDIFEKYKGGFPVVMLYIWDARKGVPSQIK
jgi:hypothetical protein